MVGDTLILLGIFVVAGSYLAREVVRRCTNHPFSWPKTSYIIILAIALTGAGIFVKGAAGAYEALIAGFPSIALPPHEAEYFAVQTATTVGYGGALIPTSDAAPAALTSEFQGLTKWLMLPLAGVWGVLIGAMVVLLYSSGTLVRPSESSPGSAGNS